MKACASLVRTVAWWLSAPFPARLLQKNSITTGKKTNVFELLYATVAILPYIGIVACIKVGAL